MNGSPSAAGCISGLLFSARRWSRNDPTQALRFLAQALTMANRAGDIRSMIDAYIVQSVTHLVVCDYDRATSSLDSALLLCDPDELTPQSTKILLNYGAINRELGKYREALAYFRRAMSAAEKIGEDSLMAVGIFDCGSLFGFQGELSISQDYLFRALRIWDKVEPLQTAAACFGIALNYEQGRLYDKALAYLHRSCELYEAMPSRQGEAMSHMAIGRIHHTLGAEHLAEHHFQQALDMAVKLGARATVAITRRSIGALYRDRGADDLAFEQLLVAADIAEEIGSPRQKIATAVDIAVCLRLRNEYRGAIETLVPVLEIAIELGDTASQKSIHNELIRCHKKVGEMGRVVEHLEAIVALHERTGEISIPNTLTLIEEQAGLHDAAGERDSLRSERTRLERESRKREHDLSTISLKLRRRDEALMILRGRMRSMSPEAVRPTVERGGGQVGMPNAPDRIWSDFTHQIDEPDQRFMTILSARHPGLTPTEMKICSLLRAHLTTKEIARLMCVVPKSVEVYRTRIRKKLMLAPGENLCAFLHALEHGVRAQAA